MMQITLQKKELRHQFKSQRRAITAEERNLRDQKIHERLFNSVTFRLADTLLCYYALDGEVSTIEIITEALKRNITVCLPRCFKDENGRDKMSFHKITSFDDLVLGMYGIHEPHARLEEFKPKGHCVCIIPGLSFDKRGFRLGYGKGYYDRFLKTFYGTKIGICHQEFLEEKLPTGKYDYKVDMIITEKGITTPDA